MEDRPSQPPRLLRALLRMVLSDGVVGRSILGDLDQEYRRRAREDLAAGRRWYRREALSVLRYVVTVARKAPKRSPASPNSPVSDRNRRGDPMWQVVLREIRHSMRGLARAPRFTLIAILTLALGIGSTTAIFSAVNGVLLRPLPYPNSERIVGLWHGAPDLGYEQFGISEGIFHQYQVENTVYEAMGLYLPLSRTLTGEGDPERIQAAAGTHDLFQVLGVQPILGRTFSSEETVEGGPAVAVLSHGLWQRRFGGRQDVLGQTVEVDGFPNEIIGVMPPGFDFGGTNRESDLWVPLHINLESGDPGNFSFAGIARLRPGVTPEAAVAQEEALLLRARERWADAEAFINFLDAGGFHPIVHSLKEEVVGDMERPLWILMGTVGFVLLIACANVANLFLVRTEGRRREMAVRASLGATRGRLALQYLAESGVLALLGGALGLAVAWVGTPLLLRMAPPELPRLDRISMDGWVLGFSVGVTALSALLFGAAPIFRYNLTGLLTVLRYSGRGTTEGRERHHLRNALVVGQTALAMILLVGSGLLVKSFQEIRSIDPGFDTEGILTFRVSLPSNRYSGPQETSAFHREMLDRLRALPGVHAAGGVDHLPLGGTPAGTAWDIEGSPAAPGELPPMFWYKTATPGYFEAMGISLLAGRGFESRDHQEELGNIVVTRALADRVWPGEDALGKRIRVSGANSEEAWERVVGIVEDLRDHGLREDPSPTVYRPIVGRLGPDAYRFTQELTFAVRADDPVLLVESVRRLVRELDPDLPLAGVRTMRAVLADSIVRLTFTALALGLAAFMALILGAVGLYGVLSYVVSERTQEIGVRMALGARAGQVQGLVVASGAKLALLGLGAGIMGAGALTRLLQGMLFGTAPLDPVTFTGMSALLLGVGLLASYLPARKAARVDPVESMRAE